MNRRPWIPLALLVPFLALTAYVLETHGYGGFLDAAFANAATVLLSVDLVLSLGLILTWMGLDARETGTPYLPYLAVTLVFGVAGPLAYLVHRGLAARRTAAARTGAPA